MQQWWLAATTLPPRKKCFLESYKRTTSTREGGGDGLEARPPKVGEQSLDLQYICMICWWGLSGPLHQDDFKNVSEVACRLGWKHLFVKKSKGGRQSSKIYLPIHEFQTTCAYKLPICIHADVACLFAEAR